MLSWVKLINEQLDVIREFCYNDVYQQDAEDNVNLENFISLLC